MNQAEKISVLFCCMGNICRSPTAHGVFETLVKKEGLSHCVEVDSAGTHAYHVGEIPDRRSMETAYQHGVDLSVQRARQVTTDDCERFDYILAMDLDNYRSLKEICPPDLEGRLHLMMDYAKNSAGVREVPDPYYGGNTGFQRVFDLIEQASEGLMADIKKRLGGSLGGESRE